MSTISDAIEQLLTRTERQCRMCGTTFVGVKLICEAESCFQAWQAHCRELDKKYRTNITGYWGDDPPYIVPKLPEPKP